MSFLFYLALFILALKLFLKIDALLGLRKIKDLKDISVSFKELPPKVSVIIPALNEEKNIKKALTTLLASQYKNMEVLVVNDRSTDSTGEILQEMAFHDSRLRVFDVQKLPKGWLGKNNALHLGAKHATGEYLLFTDADVVQEKTTLDRALSYMEKKDLDHLILGPSLSSKGLILANMIVSFVINFMLLMKPWRVKNQKSKRYIGIGAFNLVRAEAYWGSGTMEKISMRPDDDIKLGKLLKQQGFRQEYVSGMKFLSVEWYSSAREMINGLMKNSFAIFEYNIFLAILGALGIFILDVLPFVALFFTDGLTQVLYAIIVLIIYVANGLVAFNMNKTSLLKTSLFTLVNILISPVGSVIMSYIILRATFLTLLRQGISWRGTYYFLVELKKNRI